MKKSTLILGTLTLLTLITVLIAVCVNQKEKKSVGNYHQYPQETTVYVIREIKPIANSDMVILILNEEQKNLISLVESYAAVTPKIKNLKVGDRVLRQKTTVWTESPTDSISLFEVTKVVNH